MTDRTGQASAMTNHPTEPPGPREEYPDDDGLPEEQPGQTVPDEELGDGD